MDEIFSGVIDLDSGNQRAHRLRVIGRYSFENYILDPLNVFSLLLEENKAPNIPDLNITSGDEHIIKNQSEAILQKIVDSICDVIEMSQPTFAGSNRIEVKYSIGKSVTVPSWVLHHQGHELLRFYQSSSFGAGFINPFRLIKSLRRCRMIPIELAQLLSEIQSS